MSSILLSASKIGTIFILHIEKKESFLSFFSISFTLDFKTYCVL